MSSNAKIFAGTVTKNPSDKPHWRCPKCDCGNYNVLNNKTNEISCKKCSWNNRDTLEVDGS